MRVLPVVAVLLLASAPLRAQVPPLQVRLDAFPNLTYQLDCVADADIPCSTENFRALWGRELLRTARDSAMVGQWRAARARYSQEVAPKPEPGEVSFPLSGRFESLDLHERVRVAGLQSLSANDYASRLELLVLPRDRERLLEVVRHFQPRFDAWWRREAAVAGARFAQATEALLRGERTSRRLASFARFYGSVLPPGDTLRFVLLYRPELVKEGTSGQQIGTRSLVEFVPGERPEERMDVVIHELSHFLYSRTPAQALAALESRFIALAEGGSGGAVSAYNLLDEVLATTFGNGIVARDLLPPARFERLLATPGALYNQAAIDQGAKVTLRWMDAWLDAGRTIDDPDFVTRYVAGLDSALGPELRKPGLHLKRVVLVGDARFGVPIGRLFRTAFRPSSMYVREDPCCTEATLAEYRGNPGLNALFVVRPSELAQLASLGIVSAAQAEEIRGRAGSGGVVFATRRGPASSVYVLATPEAAGIQPLLQRLAAAPALFDGFLP
jgi:hypothetical protein